MSPEPWCRPKDAEVSEAIKDKQIAISVKDLISIRGAKWTGPCRSNSDSIVPSIRLKKRPSLSRPSSGIGGQKDAQIATLAKTAKEKSDMLVDRDRQNGRLMSNLRNALDPRCLYTFCGLTASKALR